MMPEPRILITSQDDMARRKYAKKALSNRVEASMVDEFGVIKTVLRHVPIVKSLPGIKKGKKRDDGDFDEKKHPRASDGRFAKNEQGSSTLGDIADRAKAATNSDKSIKEEEEQLFKERISLWEKKKANWEDDEMDKANKEISSINRGELTKAKDELAKTRKDMTEDGISDEEFDKRAKKFKEANNEVKSLKKKILKIKPKPYPEDKPKK